ncbi:hypothetical protein RM697_10120 [Ichthyenterobacterium sp. W332]|uniref:WD40 repeat domain-containing protein n=1 Tax=Microcosmobacter mediterraneus TaxID=3075607 RepID=A0ABU2YMI4_9FLAO|nr:hypothetical protein [Ichthyenterobacterium sp. W332]MDT0559005.1 hypothetical protein [Ichthyenterobacterium sp. W332]
MKPIFIFLCVISSFAYAQETISTIKIDSNPFKAKSIASIDNFGTIYYSRKDNWYIKKTIDTTLTYSNIQLGAISTSDAFNPLKINLFYKDFNTIVILDNRLAEIFKVDFNLIQDYKNVTFVSTGFDNSVWVFNQDLQQLELFNYKTLTTKIKTIPIQDDVLDLKSDYNSAWLLTTKYLYVYNYFGSLIAKIENSGFESIALDHGNLVLKKEKSLYFLEKNKTIPKLIYSSELLINQFLLTNESLYIYDGEMLHHFQLKTD